MPLIKHSPEFLAKRDAKTREQARREKEEQRAKEEQEIVDLYDQIQKFKKIDLDRIDGALKQEYEYLLIQFAKRNIPMLDFPILREAELLREILREAKLSGKYTKTPENYREIDSLIRKNHFNLKSLQMLNDIGLAKYIEDFGVKNVTLYRKKLTQVVSDYRIRKYKKTLRKENKYENPFG